MKELLRQAKVAEIESFMDQQADPCSDFYSFSCGNFAKINSALKLDVSAVGLFETMTNGFDRKILKMLNTTHDNHDTLEDIQVKHFFKSCLRLKELNSTYTAKMKRLIAEFGTMPVLEGSSWKEEDFDWLGTTARISHRYGITPIFGVEVTSDQADNQRNVIYLGEQEFYLESRSMYMDNSTLNYREKYRTKIEGVLKDFLGLKVELAKQTAKELLDFEVDLAQGIEDTTQVYSLGELTELLTVAEVHKRYEPILDIERLVSISMGETITEQIYEYNKRYQQNLVEVIKRTPKRIIANYIFFRLIWEFVESPSDKPKKQKQDCVHLTKKFFVNNVDNMFYRRYNNENSSREIDKMWRQLKETFNETLHSSSTLDWIEPPTRKLAIAKLETMTLQINNYVWENFTEEFEGLNLQSSDLVDNMLQIQLLRTRQTREKLHKQSKPLEIDEMLSFTPAYLQSENAIKMPVAMLQPFYMWSDVYPTAVLFGTLAPIIGHELIHGFDEGGKSYDAQGNYNDWWDEESNSNFVKGRECFTKQYGRYKYDGIQLKESTAQSENIADNGGMRVAFTAYRKWYESQGTKDLTKETLPKLPYTGKQLFFISFAQTLCNDIDPKLKVKQLSIDTHMPDKLRLIGTLSNYDEFSKEFNCPAGSPMNPNEKCVLY
ncbi:neprilysin-4-like [Drosophila takahashii]|uniref:neprilysin-4-like n=1 Tax=Drosophila takahashii TaxID=29030 RepID=UPI0038991835